MKTTNLDVAGEGADYREADLLFAKDLPVSVVDSLFALADNDGGSASAFDRALVSRLQRALAEKMRAIVEGDRRDAA